MFFSRKLEAFMAVVEMGSLSKAARVMNRTTPPVAKSIKDFEATLGKRLFKREKFGMILTKDGAELYNDLKELYLKEKEITKKHFSGTICNSVNIYYDWGKDRHLISLYKAADRNNAQVNILRFSYDNIDEIVDYEGNTIILSSEKILSDRFSLVRKIEGQNLGVCCRQELIDESNGDLTQLLKNKTWLCDPVLYKSDFIKNLEEDMQKNGEKANIRQMDNMECCLNFIQSKDYIFITDARSGALEEGKSLGFIPISRADAVNQCYVYKSKSHSSVLNRFIDSVSDME
ncbi:MULTISPECIES: LysR family transcriptional regulator [Xenorhabdus]|uniref:Transcriptional regulator CpsY n=1 Tax=Xenorhabdus stockiae TaxID=351614 RepID=A0A2D0KU95_9GAMM|nr:MULTISPECIES: LysR family transcriptional regulator [Xenorhabdus]MCC8367322.1 LysR family transcriptional regulator [Xenorhabdus sp. PB61.4]MCC8381686.1 LysR family transcriptional regulator [Xenorhabdus sp. PB30.3]PHM56560.1 transcriptional regulator CpsY [Xenorhabdus sp. KK7.4]PHM66971.1 transcriptional regulator CpsY [Xenorhabdus stockiae]PHM72818.1 transcriptional regulator CpsY [Xenorhabdus sp. KJ12.1]